MPWLWNCSRHYVLLIYIFSCIARVKLIIRRYLLKYKWSNFQFLFLVFIAATWCVMDLQLYSAFDRYLYCDHRGNNNRTSSKTSAQSSQCQGCSAGILGASQRSDIRLLHHHCINSCESKYSIKTQQVISLGLLLQK